MKAIMDKTHNMDATLLFSCLLDLAGSLLISIKIVNNSIYIFQRTFYSDSASNLPKKLQCEVLEQFINTHVSLIYSGWHMEK